MAPNISPPSLCCRPLLRIGSALAWLTAMDLGRSTLADTLPFAAPLLASPIKTSKLRWAPDSGPYHHGQTPRVATRATIYRSALRAQILKKFKIAWNFQSRLKFSISLENFNLAWNFQSWPPEFPTKKIGVWWVARLKISSSLENFKILKFFIPEATCAHTADMRGRCNRIHEPLILPVREKKREEGEVKKAKWKRLNEPRRKGIGS